MINKYPYTDFHELNLDWVLEKIKELSETVASWIVTSEVKFNNPINWNIALHYDKNRIVLDNLKNSYLSIAEVPAGIELSNTKYWMIIGNYDGQLETLRHDFDQAIHNQIPERIVSETIDAYVEQHHADLTPIEHFTPVQAAANLALKGTLTIISDSTMAEICQGDIDNILPNTVSIIADGCTVAHLPVPGKGGTLVVLSRTTANVALSSALFFTSDNIMYHRNYLGGRWTAWQTELTQSDITGYMHGVETIITDLNMQEICEGDLNTIKPNTIYLVASGCTVAHQPAGNTGGCYITFGRTEALTSFCFSMFITPYAEIYYRMYGGGTWQPWNSPQSPIRPKVLAVGDSICRGVRNDRKGFVGDLDFPYSNVGITGATLSNSNTQAQNIPDQLNASTYAPDVIIANGGINDYLRNAPLGTVPAAPARNDSEASALDRNTVVGGVGYLFYSMVKKFPTAQRFFLISHKTFYQNNYLPSTPNTAGYTQQDLHDILVKMCELYNVAVIDVYNESLINTGFSFYVSPISYTTDATVTDRYYVDSDGVHPLALGYKQGYVPLVREALKIGTKK